MTFRFRAFSTIRPVSIFHDHWERVKKSEVWVDDTLTHHRYIDFNACSHTELIRMDYTDFERLARPRVIAFSAGVAT